MSKYLNLTLMAGAIVWAWVMFQRDGKFNVSVADSGGDPLLAIKEFHEVVEGEMPSPDSLGLIPSCDRVVMYHDQKGNGLGAQVLRVFDAYLLSYKTNGTLLIARQMFWNYGCDLFVTWECYFEVLTPYCVNNDNELRRVDTMVSPEKCDTFRSDSYFGKQCLLIADSIAEDQVYHLVHDGEQEQDIGTTFETTKKFFQHVWKPNRSIREKAEDAMKRMGLVSGEYIGLHVRRGDKALEVPLIPMESYAEAVRLCKSEFRSIFLATDDGSIIWELHDLLPDYTIFTFADPQSTGHLQRDANEDPMRDTVLSTMSLVAEIDILRRAEYFIGTYSSNIGRLLAVLRDRPVETSISMDVSWTPGVAWRSFNTDYCRGHKPNPNYCEWKRKQEEVSDGDDFFF